MAGSETMAPEFLATFRKMDANFRWAIDHQSELLHHQGKYVAVHDQRLLDIADSAKALQKKYAALDGLYVTFVNPPDLAWLFS